MAKILVIDDSAINQASAQTTLIDSGYEIFVAASYDEGRSMMYKENPEIVLTDLLMPASADGLDPRQCADEIGRMSPVGMGLAMDAIVNGAKFVAVVTATNHHAHPASHMLDRFSTKEGVRLTVGSSTKMQGETEKTNRAVLMFFQDDSLGCPIEGTSCRQCSGSGKNKSGDLDCSRCQGSGERLDSAKNWGRVLRKLLTDTRSE